MSSFELPPFQSARGTSRQMVNSQFLDGTDLETGGVPVGGFATVVIEDVGKREGVKSNFHDGVETMWTLKLVGKKKELRCYSVTRKVLEQGFGTNLEDWIGQRIVLVRTQGPGKDGTLKDGISVQLPRVASTRGAPIVPVAPPSDAPSDASIPF